MEFSSPSHQPWWSNGCTIPQECDSNCIHASRIDDYLFKTHGVFGNVCGMLYANGKGNFRNSVDGYRTFQGGLKGTTPEASLGELPMTFGDVEGDGSMDSKNMHRAGTGAAKRT